MSLSDYLLGELREIADRPTLAEFRERLHTRKPIRAIEDVAALRITRYAPVLLLRRIWRFRKNLSAYDAARLPSSCKLH